MTRTIRGMAPGSARTPGAEYDQHDEAEFRRLVISNLQALTEHLEEVHKRVDKSLVNAVLDHVGDGHYKLSLDKRTEDATLFQGTSGHYSVVPDDLSGRRFVEFNDHKKIEA